MGAWGTGIFANDTAADVREEWRAAILDGEDPAAASDRMVRLYTREAGSELWATDFFTGLAAAQMETGRLQPAVFERLLAGSRDARSLPAAASELAALLERSGVDPRTFGLHPH